MNKITPKDKFAKFTECWSPKIIAELNGQYVKAVKTQGEYVWHSHEHEDEMFYVVEGRLDIHLRSRVVSLEAGDFFVVPRGVEHKPVSEGVAHVLLFEPASVRNTGEVDHEYTIEPEGLEWI